MRIGLVGTGRIGALHAETLRALDVVEHLVLCDADSARARDLADQLAVEHAEDVDALLRAGIDGLVVAAATGAHAELVLRGIDAGIPVFCEKPLARDVDGTVDVHKRVIGSGVAVQIGFQRRFDTGYRAAYDAVRAGTLGRVHTLRAMTLDFPTPAEAYIPTSGGFFRDCSVHDFDALRWVSGREVVEVYARGAARGAAVYRESGDVDAAAALLTLDDDSLALVSGSRYNGAGHDVRLEVLGSDGSIAVGLDDRTPLRSAEDGVTFPSGAPYSSFVDRFGPAYRSELAAFTRVVAGTDAPACTVDDALETFYVAEACELSRAEGRPVQLSEVRR